jgi:hypothetical protein
MKKIIIGVFCLILFCMTSNGKRIMMSFTGTLAESIGYVSMLPIYFLIFFLLFKVDILEKTIKIKTGVLFRIILGLILGVLIYRYIIDSYSYIYL